MIHPGSIDDATGRWYNRRIVIRNGIRKDKPLYVRHYSPSEIKALITKAGLEVHKIFGGFDSQHLSNESRKMVIIARTPKDN